MVEFINVFIWQPGCFTHLCLVDVLGDIQFSCFSLAAGLSHNACSPHYPGRTEQWERDCVQGTGVYLTRQLLIGVAFQSSILFLRHACLSGQIKQKAESFEKCKVFKKKVSKERQGGLGPADLTPVGHPQEPCYKVITKCFCAVHTTCSVVSTYTQPG